MIYYKVKGEFDNVQVTKTGRNGKIMIDRFLVGNELYTRGELAKLLKGATFRGCGVKDDTIIFDEIEVSPKKTYFFFGARFAA